MQTRIKLSTLRPILNDELLVQTVSCLIEVTIISLNNGHLTQEPWMDFYTSTRQPPKSLSTTTMGCFWEEKA